jgi:hypothetical protein
MAKKTAMRGGELMVFVDDTCYPLATQCSVSGNISMLDPQTKDDSIHQTPDEESKQWTVSGDNQSDDAFNTFLTLLSLAQAHEPVDIEIGKPANASTEGVPNGGWTAPVNKLSGKAYVQQVSFNAPVEGKATLSFQLSGCSDLA